MKIAAIDIAFLIMFTLKLLTLISISWWIVFSPVILKCGIILTLKALGEEV